MKTIIVIGCGVIGLTTAIRLQEAGYDITIITKDLPFETVSAKAAAIWLPYKVEPLEKVNQWSLFTYHKMEVLSKDPDTGISMIDFIVLAQNNETPEWKAAIPENALRAATKEEIPEGYKYGNVAKVPLIETPIYLKYLLDTFRNNSGTIIQKELHSIGEIEGSYSMIINCSGLGSRKLVNDQSLYPIRGQIIKVDPIEGIACIADDDGPNALAYIIPRRDCVILGGTAQSHQNDLEINPKDTQNILKHCKNIESNLDNIRIQSIEVGLRPARPQIRLEREAEAPIIHNYGHGGGGFTVSWGCVEAVIQLLD